MHANKIIWLSFLLMSFVCWGADISQIQKNWLGVYQVDINPNLTAEKNISEPVNTHIRILSVNLHNQNFEGIKNCLVYKTPLNGKGGELKLLRMSLHDNCEDKLLDIGEILVQNVFNFGFKQQRNRLTLFVDDKTWVFEFLNLAVAKSYERYDKSFTTNKYPGLSLAFDIMKGEKQLEEGDICFDIDKNCNVTKKNICHLCPAGVLEVKAGACNKYYRRYCSDQTCGEKNQYACLRGSKAVNYRQDYCIAGSPVAFCKAPNQVICFNGELVCR